MRSESTTTTEVADALDELRKVIGADRLRENFGLKAEPRELEVAWENLTSALARCIEVIERPIPGQGLEALWLRTVYERVEVIDDAREASPGGWQQLIDRDDSAILSLVTADWEAGYYVGKVANRKPRALPPLKKPSSFLEQLSELAGRWSTTWQQMTNEDGGKPPLWRCNNAPEYKQAGELLLEAINACEINPVDVYGENAAAFVLRNLETPSALTYRFMTGEEAEDLATLVTRLTPKPEVTTPARGPSEPYSLPDQYGRDKWIYENMPGQTCRSLSALLKNFNRPRGWTVISGRNSLKEAADRYAVFHGFPKRRFNDDPK